jgi:hypothetical protein
VAACDKEHLGFLLDPFRCDYDPAKDAGALCAGTSVDGVIGSNADTASCLTAKEALAIDKIWYGATSDGSYEPNPSSDVRTGKKLGPRQLWWPYTRGADIGGLITSPGTDLLVLMMQDAGYASSYRSSYTSAAGKFVNPSTATRDKWTQLSYSGLADAFAKSELLQNELGDLFSSNPDLSKLRNRGAKILVHHGLGEDVLRLELEGGSFEEGTRLARQCQERLADAARARASLWIVNTRVRASSGLRRSARSIAAWASRLRSLSWWASHISLCTRIRSSSTALRARHAASTLAMSMLFHCGPKLATAEYIFCASPWDVPAARSAR